ncbi:DUF3108 domain-containing protein [Oricola cellulosilytica]|uniref:DUF3108 domain-containing protein n=1 Tax=Oricola cellulosilytica TaxID=1429082 RepID=A0A4R0PA05_9HYPH|nr:DUF3108 domain-containing protein [Oricola cellulosilytica]TCD13755.1 DUF3108 domain-containing protein [Oricola cellulosilytica]
MRVIGAASFLFVLASAPQPAAQEGVTHNSEYRVTALGLPVGTSAFQTAIAGDVYALKGSVNSSGLAQLFAPTSGTLKVSGRIGSGGVEANAFAMHYKTGKKRQRTAIGFRRGSIASIVNEPEPRKGADWIDVHQDQLRNALDPISAMLVRAGGPAEVCNRTVRVFDGAMRADIAMSYLRTVPFYTEGFNGDAVTCRARFIPVSGYSGGKKEIAWMRDKGRIEIGFAPIAGTELYAPVTASISTQIGKVRIRATRFQRTGAAPELTAK